jgi:CelD/BcsL family acetyltransferase involved in cellulose biosynthesis
MREIREIDSYDKMLQLEPHWNALLAGSDLDIPFMTFEWFKFWWQFFDDKRQMLILAVYDDGKLSAIAPLMRIKTTWRGLPVNVISFAVDYYSGRTGIIAQTGATGVASSIFERLVSGKYAHDLLDIDFLPQDSLTGSAISKTLSELSLRFVKKPRIKTPYIPISGNWDNYLAGRSKNFRHKLSRINNKFQRLGGYEITKCTGAGFKEALEQVEKISLDTWKFNENSAIINSPEKTKFFRGLSEMLSQSGWLNIWILKIKGEPAAFAYNVKYKNKVYALEIGYAQSQAQLSPSEFLNTEAIKDGFDNGLVEYDWLGDALPFKMKWTSLVRVHDRYWVFGNTFYGRLLYLVEKVCAGLIDIRMAARKLLPGAGVGVLREDVTT